MKNTLKRIYSFLSHHGFSPLPLLNLRHLPKVLKDARTYQEMTPAHHPFPFRFKNFFPILNDLTDKAGVTTTHYFIQDLFMARKVIAQKPEKHIDIGSRLDGFVAHLLAAGIPTTMVDIRPLDNAPEGLSFVQDDATQLATFSANSVTSLSTLHVAEHFGLGRYGDPIDPEACFAYMRSLARVLAKGGTLYFSTPVGKERLEFNAHRVFAPATIINTFGKAGLTLKESGLITSKGQLVFPADTTHYGHETFACGLYIFTK